MNESRKQTLGAMLRQARTEQGLSIRRLAAMSGVRQTAIVRLESDEIEHPLPENLVALANALELKASDLFLAAGIPVPDDLPSLDVMLRAEYDLPEAGIREAEASIRAIVAKYCAADDGQQNDESAQTTHDHT